jgi:hypothetical protein
VTPTTHEIALQGIYDAMALRGPDENGGYLMTTEPTMHMSAERLRLARAILKNLPPNTTHETASEAAVKLCPFVRALLSK